MAEQKSAGGVVYRKADAAYFEKRGLSALCRRLVAVGARRRRRHLGPLLGLESRARHRRLGRHAGRRRSSSPIMYLGLVFCIAEMAPALPHTGARLFLRAHARWDRGAASSPASARTSSTS